jgi:hypothetical protein
MSGADETPFRLGTHLRGEGIVEFRYADTFELQETEERERLLIAPSGRQVDLLLRLMREMSGPFSLLYILLAPHTNARAGRYLASGQSHEAVQALLEAFRDYFEGDARHHVWIGAEGDGSLLVYDQHNVIYAYGPVEQFASILMAQGLRQDTVEFPFPHTHHFRSVFDGHEDRLLSEFEWEYSPLEPEDEE